MLKGDNVINYSYSTVDSMWLEGLNILDENNRQNNWEHELVILPLNTCVYVKLPSGERKILDITRPSLKDRRYESIVTIPGEYSYSPEPENFDDLENLLKSIMPASSMEKFREILGTLIFLPKDKILVLNFVLSGSVNFTIIKNLIKYILRYFPGGMKMDNILQVSKTMGIQTIDFTHQDKEIRVYKWNIEYILRKWYRETEQFNSSEPRILLLNNEYTECKYLNTRLNKLWSSDDLARDFEYDTFIINYELQVKPYKYIFKCYGVNPIKIVKCESTFPTMISFTYNSPLEKINLTNSSTSTRNKFKVFQLKVGSDSVSQKEFIEELDKLKDKLHRWVLSGVIIKREKGSMENIGFIDTVLE